MDDGSGYGYEPHLLVDGVPTLIADINPDDGTSGFSPAD